jgi:cell division protease FtsH
VNRYRSLFLGLALLALFFTVINSFNFGSGSSSVPIQYSRFLKAIEAGQISSVAIRGERVEGIFRNGKIFHTNGPLNHTQKKLLDLLRERQVVIEIKPEEGNPWYISLLLQWSPLLLLVGVWIFMMRKMPGSGKIFSVGKSQARKYEEDENKVTFKDVAGVAEAKEDLEEIIDFLKAPDKFHKLGGKIPKGVLMVGPPGTGKTLLAKAVAGEAAVPFFSISGSDFVEMFVGVGASRVRDLFEEGRQNAPCILFIDEIDAVGRHRGAGLGSGHDEREQTLNQLLVEMDGFNTTEGVIVIAATNRIDILDPALLRPGRFDRQVHVGLPDIKGRHQILTVHSKKIALADNVNLETIARGTPGFSGAELANLTNEAALWAARGNKDQVELEDLEWARDKVMMGAERKSMIMTDEEKNATAYHEAGHTLVAAFLEKVDPIHKVTIIPRGRALGLTAFLPKVDRLSYDKETLLQRIMVSMGGRAAEELIFKDLSTGAEGDLQQATGIANNMVCKWGMSEKLGALTINHNSGSFLAMDYDQGDQVSNDMQMLVDQEVRALLTSSYNKAYQILSDNIEKLHKLAKLLLEKETVSGETFWSDIMEKALTVDTPTPPEDQILPV